MYAQDRGGLGLAPAIVSGITQIVGGIIKPSGDPTRVKLIDAAYARGDRAMLQQYASSMATAAMKQYAAQRLAQLLANIPVGAGPSSGGVPGPSIVPPGPSIVPSQPNGGAIQPDARPSPDAKPFTLTTPMLLAGGAILFFAMQRRGRR